MKGNRKIKVHVVGGSIGYANWLNRELVSTIEEADLVLFTGGSDIDPSIYKARKGQFTSCNLDRDIYELADAQKAMNLGKKIWGTCRGIQLGCAMSGGLLVQHMNHPHMHSLQLYDGSIISSNSLHHQLQYPFNMSPDKYHIIAHAKGLSNVYLNGENTEMSLPSNIMGEKSYIKEPEIVYYRKTNWLGAQHHPEMMSYGHETNVLLRAMVELLLDDKLDLVLSLRISTNRYINRELVLTDDELQMYNQFVATRIKKELLVN